VSNKIEQSIENKIVISRDDSRGWRISECFIEDACSLLNLETPVLNDETLEDTQWEVDRLERLTEAAGYTTVWDGGYLIYKDLTTKELSWLSQQSF